MTFQQEPVSDTLIQEVFPLLEMHYKEISHYPDIEFAPDLEAYKAVAASGNLRVFTAREEGVIVGYSVFFLRHNMHYQKSYQAVQDIIYIDPKKRGFGMKFIGWCDEQLKAEGVQVVYQHVKAKHDFGPMLKRMNYELIDLIYGRRLDHG